MTSHRRLAVLSVLAALVVAGTSVTVDIGVSSAAVEPPEVNSFETSPGLTRTSLTVDVMDFDPVSGLLYTVSNIDGRERLRAIDVDTVEVVAETLVGDGLLGVFDIDVSRDGRTVFVATSEGVVSFRRADLTILRIVPFDGDDPTRVDASPDNPGRFVGTINGRGVIADDGGLIEVADAVAGPGVDLVFPPLPPFAWGADSDTLYAGVSDLTRLEVADPPVAQAVMGESLQVGEVRDSSLTFQNGRLLGEAKLVDPELLEVTSSAPPEWMSPTKGGAGDIVMRTIETDPVRWGLFDGDDLTLRREWTLPVGAVAAQWIALSNDRFAVLERGGGRSYLTIGDARRLATGYGELTPLQPARVLDTRSGVGRDGPAGKLDAGQTISVQMAGRGGLPDDGVLAVVMNATVTAPTESSFFSIWPSGEVRPGVSNLNFGQGQQIANLVTVAVGEDGSVNLSNEFGSAHALLDVVGYYGDETGGPGARYSPIETTQRLVDTRATANREGTTLRQGETRTFGIESFSTVRPAGRGEIVAVALNITAVRPTDAGFFTVWPAGNPQPTASSLNFAAGDIRANLAVVAVGEGDQVSIFNRFGSVDLLVDVFGVYETFDEGRLDQQGRFLPVEPFRRFDSRARSPFAPPGSLGVNSSLITSNFHGWTDVWNVTAVQPTENGFLSVLGYDENDPNTTFPQTSNVNFRAGENVANAVYAPGAPDTEIYNPFGRTHVLIDVFGYLTPEVQRPIEEVWGPAS